MDGWITHWRQKNSRGRRRPWLWLLVAVAVLFTGTGWGVMNFAWKQVTLQVDGREIVARTFARQVGRFLNEQQITLGPEDVVLPALDAPVTKGMVVTVKRAVLVKIIADGQEKEILTPPVTVAEVLSRAGVTLQPEDRVTPAVTATVRAGDTIKVTRVTYKMETVNSEINYRVERRPDGEIEKGITRLVQRGQKGLQEETYRIVYEDGQEAGRELVATKVVKEPVPEIIAVGALDMASRGGHTFRFERAFWAVATAYTHTGSRTATGVYPRVGTIAVDPDVIPLGTRLYVEGYGFGIAQDVGSAIKGNRIDVFLDTEAATARWGVRRVKVYVLR
ncbi:ubiquitin-like domain-containing protein [Neomoorella mulderi]|uniref:Cell wall-binding protein YocH n=1 Tax=Moorella mulderi DSM 14980 TaxID=1122241 RepID=A0A151B1N6_9FIRM|nr:ubiquitin-like domain-containing protein [Moorella mulderi]KYH33821.1 cell wall-binding protein YocH precursor [Moorella mulderi DSM 14980]